MDFCSAMLRSSKCPACRVGGNVKVVYRFIGDFAKSWGFGIDLAATYRHKDWRFSVMGRDLTSTYNAWTYSLDDATKDVFVATGNELPKNGLEITLPKIVLGAAYKKELNKFALQGEINAVLTTDGQRNVLVSADPISIDPLIGLEASYINLIYLRAGLGNMQRIKTFRGTEDFSIQPNLGLRFKIRKFQPGLCDNQYRECV